MWWMLLGLAQAGEISVTVATPVAVQVDGVMLEPEPNSMQLVARGLAGGTHLVEIRNIVGKPVTELTVEVGPSEQLQLRYARKVLSEIGRRALAPDATATVTTTAAVDGQQVVTGTSTATETGVSMSATVTDPVTGEVTQVDVSSGTSGISMSIGGTSGTAATPEPPAPAGPVAMAPGPFETLRKAVEDESFSDDKLDLVRTAAAHNHFTCVQVGQLMDGITMGDDKVEIVRITRPRILDPGNAATLSGHLRFSSDREDVQALFR